MAMRHWLMSLVIAAAAQAAAANADELELAPDAGAPSTGAEIKAGGARTNSASEPIAGSYQFLLEVAGVTPAETAQVRKRTAGPSLRRDPRVVEEAIDAMD